jgi:phospholipase/carboxylesterase
MTVNNKKTLEACSFLPHTYPNKLIFLLHGYGDNADNFIHIANAIHQSEWKANYVALDAPSEIHNYPLGREWFNLYPNGTYIAEAGVQEINTIKFEVLSALKQINNTIKNFMDKFSLKFSDCLVLGFSQGGMMTFELGNYLDQQLGGLAIISGRIFEECAIKNINFLSTPLFISHGDKDSVLPVENFYRSCDFLKENKFNYESYLLKGDSHTISPETIALLQKFIKKNL